MTCVYCYSRGDHNVITAGFRRHDGSVLQKCRLRCTDCHRAFTVIIIAESEDELAMKGMVFN